MIKTLPNHWERVKLGDLGNFRNGVNFSKDKKGFGLGLINVKDVFNDNPYIDFESLDKVDLSNKTGIDTYYVKKGDIFFSRSSVKRDGVGVVSLAKESNFQTIFCGFIIRFRLSSKKVDSLFLTYLLRSEYYRKVIIGISGGSAIINISQDSLASLEISLPPLPTQRKIAGILSAYDDLIENNTRRIEILEEMARMLYREWFVKFRFPVDDVEEKSDRLDDRGDRLGDSRGDRSLNLSELVESELGLIPKGWEVKQLINVCTLIMGQSPKSEFYNEIGEGLPFHQGVTNFGDRFPTNKTYTTVLKRIAQEGDILFSVRAPVGRLNLANTQMVLGRGLCSIRSKDNHQEFLFQQLKEKFHEDDLIGGGTIYKSVTKDDIQNIKILIPSLDLIIRFSQNIKPIFRELEILTEKNINLRKTRDLLLPRLISGEIDVENLDINIGEIKP